MSEVDIPFNEWSTNRHIDGVKTATTRTSRYGRPGDTFTDAGRTYRLTHVVEVPLKVVAKHFYDVEGARSPGEFVEVWEDIHYGRGYIPKWDVWLHLYREAPDE